MALRDAAAVRRKSLRGGRGRWDRGGAFSPGLLALALGLFIAVCALLVDRGDTLGAFSRVGRALEAAARLIASVDAPF
jgi:Flp pilus assembly protein TadG